MKHGIATLLTTGLLTIGASTAWAETLENDLVLATFDDNGLVSIHDKQLDETLEFSGDYWSFVIDHHLVDSIYVPAK